MWSDDRFSNTYSHLILLSSLLLSLFFSLFFLFFFLSFLRSISLSSSLGYTSLIASLRQRHKSEKPPNCPLSFLFWYDDSDILKSHLKIMKISNQFWTSIVSIYHICRSIALSIRYVTLFGGIYLVAIQIVLQNPRASNPNLNRGKYLLFSFSIYFPSF